MLSLNEEASLYTFEYINCKCGFSLITNYGQQDATFLEFIFFYRCSTCFRRFLRPSSGAHNCTYSLRYCQPILLLAATVEEMELTHVSSISSTVAAGSSNGWQYLKLYVQFCAPVDGRRNHLKRVRASVKKVNSRNVASR